MERLLVLFALSGSVLGGSYVQPPFINPAGVTYYGNAPLPAQPLQYVAPPAVRYAPAPALPYAPAAPYAPAQYTYHKIHQPTFIHQAPVIPVPPPVVPVAPAPVVHTHYKYPAPVIKYFALLPTAKKETQDSLSQIDEESRNPAIKKTKYEVRRPAVRKDFYDIEHTIVIKEAGSAVLELDEPVSKTKKSETIVRPMTAGGSVSQTQASQEKGHTTVEIIPAIEIPVVSHVPHVVHPVRVAPVVHVPHPVHVTPAVPVAHVVSVTPAAPIAHAFRVTPIAVLQVGSHVPWETQQPTYPPQGQSTTTTPYPPPTPPRVTDEQQTDEVTDQDVLKVNYKTSQRIHARSPAKRRKTKTTTTEEPEEVEEEEEEESTEETPSSAPIQEASDKSFFSNTKTFPFDFESILPKKGGSKLIKSVKNTPEISKANQERLIELLTGQGQLTEIDLTGREPSITFVGKTGQVRGRVVSATPAPKTSKVKQEHFHTRRIVITSPIETFEEVEETETLTKAPRTTSTENYGNYYRNAQQGKS